MTRMWKFLNLSATDRRLLVSAAVLLGAVRLGLWLLPFQTLRRLLTKMTRHATAQQAHPSRTASIASIATEVPNATTRTTHVATTQQTRDYLPDRIVWAVVVASRYVPKSTCLTQALTAQVLLAQRGFPAQLHIGVAKQGEDKPLEAHAWVESEGRIVIGGSGLGHYTRLSGLERQSL